MTPLTVLTEYFTSETTWFEELTLLFHSSLMLTVIDGIT